VCEPPNDPRGKARQGIWKINFRGWGKETGSDSRTIEQETKWARRCIMTERERDNQGGTITRREEMDRNLFRGHLWSGQITNLGGERKAVKIRVTVQ